MIKVLCFIFISALFTNVFSADKFENILKVDYERVLFFHVGSMFERKENIPEYLRLLAEIEVKVLNLTELAPKEPRLTAETVYVLHPKSRDILNRIIDKKTNTITERRVLEALLLRYAIDEDHGYDEDLNDDCKKYLTSESMFDPPYVRDFISSRIGNICGGLPKLTSYLNRVYDKDEKLRSSIHKNINKEYIDKRGLFEYLDITQ